jgi:hypothetical protein
MSTEGGKGGKHEFRRNDFGSRPSTALFFSLNAIYILTDMISKHTQH